MGCSFAFLLVGDSPEELAAAAEAGLDEVSRIEKLLSRHDPDSEVSRLNREAGKRMVKVDPELLQLLVDCGQVGLRTAGHFDLTAPGRRGLDRASDGLGSILVDPERCLMRFSRPDVCLDFGGVGKGYALDRAAAVLRDHGVHQGLLQAGKDLALALDGGWEVGLRSPGAASEAVAHVPLARRALSNTVTVDENGESSIVRPTDGRPVTDPAACAVIARSAAEAEALSTAFLAMGRQQTGRFCTSGRGADLQVAWLEDDLSWLRR